MSSSSVRAWQRALDFTGRRLGHPDERSQPPVFEAGRDARNAHRGDWTLSRFPDHVALGEGVLARPSLLDFAPDPRGTHALEPGKVLGICLQNLLDFDIRQRSEQGEAA